jgi:hypothetical protein
LAASYRKGSFLFGLKKDKPHEKLIKLHHDNGKPDENPRRKAKGPYYRLSKGISNWQPATEGEEYYEKAFSVVNNGGRSDHKRIGCQRSPYSNV